MLSAPWTDSIDKKYFTRSIRDGLDGLQENSNKPLTFYFSACLVWDLFLWNKSGESKTALSIPL